MKKRRSALFFCLLLCIAIVPAAFAGSDEPTSGIASEDPYFTDRYYSETSGIFTYAAPVFKAPVISISSPAVGKISIYVKPQTLDTCTKIGFRSNLVLQYWTGSRWGTSASWSEKYATNAKSYTFSQTLD